MCIARVEVQAAMNKQKGPLLMRFIFLLLHLQSFHAMDFWQTDYYVGNLQHGSANAASDVCDSMVSWGDLTVFHGHIADCDGSFSAAAIICRARFLYKGDDSIGASLLLCQNKHLLEIVNRSSLETALIASNLLAMSLFSSAHFSGSRAVFNLSMSIANQFGISGGNLSSVYVDTFDSADEFAPASAAIYMNAARVAVDAWDLSSAREFLVKACDSGFLFGTSQEGSSSSHVLCPQSNMAKSEHAVKTSMAQYSQYILSLPAKPMPLRLSTSFLAHVMNCTSIVRAFFTSPSDANRIEALLDISSWEHCEPDLSNKYYGWPPHIAQGIIMDLSSVISSNATPQAVSAAVNALDGFIGMSPEGEESANCHIACRTVAVDALLSLLSINATRDVTVPALSALTYLVECGGSLIFSNSGGAEVLSVFMKRGSIADRARAANLMQAAVGDAVSIQNGFATDERNSLIYQGHINRMVFRFTLSMAPLQIYLQQQAGTSLEEETLLVQSLLKGSDWFSEYWKQLSDIMALKQQLMASGTTLLVAKALVLFRVKGNSTHGRLAWAHSGAQGALVDFFGDENAASAFAVDLIPGDVRLNFDAAPHSPGQTGVYDPIGLFDNFGSQPNHRDVQYTPQCSGLATNLLQCWIFKASRQLHQEECDYSGLLSCHHFNWPKNFEKMPNVPLPQFLTSVATRHGLQHLHLFDLYFTASLSVYGEWSFLESEMIIRHIPVGGTFLDIGAHIGTISIAIAEHVGPTGKVIAVEAQQNLCEMIERTANANSMPQLSVEHAAVDVSNSRCVTSMISTTLAMPTNFGGFEVSNCNVNEKGLLITKNRRAEQSTPTFHAEIGTTRAVMSTTTIDAIVEEHGLTSLHAIKLDCEGSEHRALMGGLKSLKRFSPAVFFEDNSILWNEASTGSQKEYVPETQQMKDLYDGVLRPLGYNCIQHHVPVFNPRNFRGRSVNLFGGQSSVVVFCLGET
jgi:FkbM family methyltransferase